jgi:hypothetical protein
MRPKAAKLLRLLCLTKMLNSLNKRTYLAPYGWFNGTQWCQNPISIMERVHLISACCYQSKAFYVQFDE